MEKLMEFSTAVRGFHYYKTHWIPTENECLDCSHEKENPYDYFAITCKKDGMIVGHLPMEISHPTKCLLDRGARITATLTSTSYYASPLVQGGLEIPCLLKIFLPRKVKNTQIISMYEEMIERKTEDQLLEVYRTVVKRLNLGTAREKEQKENALLESQATRIKSLTML